MLLAWLTDIHLNFLQAPEIEAFCESVGRCPADAILLSGDVSDAHDIDERLAQLEAAVARPIYFVLGNHDYYGGSIREVRAAVRRLCEARPNLHYLTDAPPIELVPGVGVVGHDGWADARLGDYERSFVMMNDYKLIAELAGMNKAERWPVLRALGDEAAAELRRSLLPALERFSHLIVATHLPPLREACWHEGRISDDEWAPHFTCKAIGDMLLEVLPDYPHRRVDVYCGHTHSPGVTRPLANLTIHTGGSEYGRPEIQQLLELTASEAS
ncbi:MAG TPA: metallophosphoesterase [Pirellulales bacterium]